MSDLPTFRAENGRVAWLTGRGTIYLDERQIDGLLDIFGDAEGGAELFNQLWEARADLAVEPLGRPSAIAVLKPLTCTVRQLDPAIWGDAIEGTAA